MKYSRKEVRERLRKTLEAGRPVIAAGAGIGLSAKFAEKGGADLIIIYNSGRYRMTGYSSLCGYLPIGDSNAIVKEMGAARKENREIIALCHGGPIAVPSDFAFMLEHTDVEGFVGASSMERLPVEIAIESTTKAFKALRVKGRRVPLSP
jgi:predicted TIM-barrel enzyme